MDNWRTVEGDQVIRTRRFWGWHFTYRYKDLCRWAAQHYFIRTRI